MKFLKFIMIPILISQCIYSMDRPKTQQEIQCEETNQRIDQLKKMLFDKASPEAVQKFLDELRQKDPSGLYYAIKNQKASLVGNAESAARVVDIQVQNLARKNKPIPADLQEQHANARTNLHLVKDFIYNVLSVGRRRW